MGRGCDLAFGTFHIDIHYVASVAGKGAAYSCPGFLIDSLVRQDFHRKLGNCAGTHAQPHILYGGILLQHNVARTLEHSQYIVRTALLGKGKLPIRSKSKVVNKRLVCAYHYGNQFLSSLYVRKIQEIEVEMCHCPLPQHFILIAVFKGSYLRGLSHKQVG